MPSTESVLTSLTTIANEWRWLAVAWHVVLGAFLLLLAVRWRPSVRLVTGLLVLPLLTVSLTAWLSGNPFNGLVFAILSVALLAVARRLPRTAITISAPHWVTLGGALIGFGWTYPHFLQTDSWTAYTYASPFGLLPCPTLAAVIGITLLVVDLRARPWTTTLAVSGLIYGVIGVFRLGVALDWVLLVASASLTIFAGFGTRRRRSVRASESERRRRLPGDELINSPAASMTHAITIRRPANDVWPWLIQMGAGSRAGWYSFDWLDNGRRPSATHVIPALQHVTVGSIFPAAPGVSEGFVLLALDPDRALVLGRPSPGREPMATWAFLLERQSDDSTRLIVRARAASGYRFFGVPPWASTPLARLVHFVMERKQLLGIARRAEAMTAIHGDRAASRRTA